MATLKASETPNHGRPILTAIDPGPEKSGWVRYAPSSHYDNDKLETIHCGIMENDSLLDHIGFWEGRFLVIEMTASMGMAVGDDVHMTTLWAGRFYQAHVEPHHPVTLIKRHEVKMHLCGTTRAKDSNIRQRLIDLWGGKDQAIGLKKTPGPLYHVKADCWQALALAVTWWEVCRATAGKVE